MSVVGFDIGNLTCYVAVAKQGGIETVTNEYSQRNTPSYVAFTDKVRLVGQDAKNIQLTGTNFRNTVFNCKRLLGRKYSDPFVREYCQSLPYKIVPTGTENDEVSVKVKYQNNEETYTVTQIMAAMLGKLKIVAEEALQKKVIDCVISVPSFYTDIERRAMVDAARIAELNCLRLINDTTATGLCYGFFRKELPEADQPPRNVVFVDFGHCSLQVAVIAFNRGQMKVLGVTCDPYIGGLMIDKMLTNKVAAEFQEKYKMDALNQVRPYLKLMNELEKLKMLMSANKQKLPMNIDQFMNDRDVTASVSRSEMEEACTAMFQRVKAKLEEVFKFPGIEKGNIHSVEVVGGSSRVSRFKDIVHEVFGLEPSTTLNADESVARGCALQCAMLSSASQVQVKWTITDVCQYPVSLKWEPTSEKDSGSIELFPYNHVYPATKILTFYKKEPFKVEAEYSYPQNVPYHIPQIGQFTIHDVVPTADGGPAKIKVKLHMNKHGIFNVSEASLVEKVEEKQTSDTASEVDMKSPTKQDNTTDSGASQGKPEAANEGSVPNGQSEDANPMETDPAGDPTADPELPKEPATENEQVAKKKTKVRNIPLPVKHEVSSLSVDKINDCKRSEQEFQKAVLAAKEKADAKNALEEYILELRRQLSEELEPYVKASQVSGLREQLNAAEDWLFEDGEDCEKLIYLDKLVEMKKIGTPIFTRKIEFEARPRVLENFGARLQHFSKILDQYSQKVEAYDHISEEDMQKVKNAVKEKRDWFDGTSNKLMKVNTYDDPPITVAAIKEQVRSLDSTCNPIVNKTKPKPKVEQPPPTDKKDEKAPTEGPTDKPDDPQHKEGQNGDAKMDVDPSSEVD